MICPINGASSTTCPAIFSAADEDDFIYPHHSRSLEDEYCGQSRFVSFDGDHNSERPPEFLDEVRIFFMRTLHGSRPDDIWKAERDKAAAQITAPRDADESLRESQNAESAKRHMELLKHSPFGDDSASAGSFPIPEPPPDPAEADKRAAEEAKRAAARRERQARDLARRQDEPRSAENSPQRRAPPPRSPAGANGGYSNRGGIAAPSQAAPSKADIKQQLIALGFTSSQVEKAMLRSSTLEGCVEWILTES